MRAMRLLVMFDLPTKTKTDKDNYVAFRRFLEDDGYCREQNSVYSRCLMSRASGEAHKRRLSDNIPPAGSVVVFEFTDQQYCDRKVLVDTRPASSLAVEAGTQLLLEF